MDSSYTPNLFHVGFYKRGKAVTSFIGERDVGSYCGKVTSGAEQETEMKVDLTFIVVHVELDESIATVEAHKRRIGQETNIDTVSV